MATLVARRLLELEPAGIDRAGPPAHASDVRRERRPIPHRPDAVGAIDHKTGATDVVLRLEQGGGFVPMEFHASQAPSFTLYGNGVVVFQPTVTVFPQPDANGVMRPVPWRTGKLDEWQIQELLEFALTNGGLGTARDTYMSDRIADAPNTIFTIHAGGIDKMVVVNAWAGTAPGPDRGPRGVLEARRAPPGLRPGRLDRHRRLPAPIDTAASSSSAMPSPGVADVAGRGRRSSRPTSSPAPRWTDRRPDRPHRTMTAEEIAPLKLTGSRAASRAFPSAAPTARRTRSRAARSWSTRRSNRRAPAALDAGWCRRRVALGTSGATWHDLVR